ncbi:MAG: alpha-glucosidase [Chloroflexota bacterium]
MKRVILLGLGVLGGVGATVGWWRGQQHYRQRQIIGRLTCDAPSMHFSIGQFLIFWENDHGRQLRVYHQEQTERPLWSSIAGQGFVAAARGAETVTEVRGNFFVEDQLHEICADQYIERFAATGDTVTVSGILQQRRGSTKVGYTFTLTARTPNQLSFALAFTDRAYNRSYLTYAADPSEHFFGFGEQFSHFDLKGKRLPIFIMEQGIGRGAQPITLAAHLQARAGGAWHTSYSGVPHYITSRLRSLFLENYEYVVFDMRKPDRVHIQLFAEQMAGRLIYGTTPSQLIEEYTTYTGRMRPLPDWIHDGAIVGLQGGTEQVRHLWSVLHAHHIPITALWLQDWVGRRTTSFGEQLWWNWELDRERYPEWEQLRNDLAEQGIKILTYINPFFVDTSEKPGVARNLFEEAKAHGFLVKRPNGEPYLQRSTDFDAGLLDITNPAAYAWMQDIIKEQVIGVGAAGWMADYAEGLPCDAVLFSGESATHYHNAYPETWARLNRELVDTHDNGQDLVFFVRAGYRQSPGLTTLFWLGDQLVSWDRHDGLKTAVTGLLSSGMSGFSFNHSDIGGYTTISTPLFNYHRSKELLLRWIELNAFTTVFRSHEGNRPLVNAQIYSDEETLAHFGRFAKVYRAWGFYRRQLVQEAATTGMPVVRHLFVHYPNDSAVYGLSYEQFLVGSELLIAPVLDPGQDTVTVYLPRGRWVHIWSGNTYGSDDQATRVTVAAPLGQPGVFYQCGSEVGMTFVAHLEEEGCL